MKEGKKVKESKRKIDAPCGFFGENFKGEIIMKYPNVDCEKECDRCGWNPEVRGKRLAAAGLIRRCELEEDKTPGAG